LSSLNTRTRHTVAATFYLIHPPTQGSLESSHFLTSSMYLFHFLTSVDSTKSCSPFVDINTIFPEGRQYLDSHSRFNERSRMAQGKHHCSLLSLALIKFDANTFSCYGGSYFVTIAVISIICRRPLNLVGTSMPASSPILIFVIIAYYSEYVPLQTCLLPLSSPPPRVLQLSTPTLQSSFFRVT
jgi:hypothetical protein